MSQARWEPPDTHGDPPAMLARSVISKKKKRNSHYREKFGMPEERNATVLKMTADIEQNEKAEYE